MRGSPICWQKCRGSGKAGEMRMLTIEQIRRVAQQSGARDISKVETDIILTYVLQLFHERGIVEHVAFKGGTMLRKMIFGPRGRYSTDLDFTRRNEISDEDIMELMLDALNQPYHGLSFRFDRDKDWYFTDRSLAANPVCVHAGNERGVKIKLEVSLRERPILPVRALPQIDQEYFKLLLFKPASIPSLAYDEVVSEKVRAASQRSKIRDLHDLSEVADTQLNRDVLRSLAVIKLWESDQENLDYERFAAQVEGGKDYDVGDLTNLLRKDQRVDLKDMIRRAKDGFRFLGQMTELERKVAQDRARRGKDEVAALKAEAVKRAAA
jgi:predicted nucleotidyltransferase component of viral defense system